MTRPFRSVLVANRGEIAVRVLTEARAAGMRAIAVHSDADAGALHVRAADLAVRIGPAPAAESYLKIEAVLEAARRTGAEAIHPGYGFLSENAGFAQAVIAAGLVWIGPPPEAIAAMGDKARAKTLMIKAGVPVAPGWQGEAQDEATLAQAAAEMGWPLLIKASAGGGGRGMRVVRAQEAFAEALAAAQREAQASFGDATVLLERFVERGRHVEIQVFADVHGRVVSLGERDCSAQRRRQKVIEEAPSPAMNADLRARMGADAVAAARAVGYVGAGTVEFLLDDEGRYYFLEMNTRLQVEHPVTEEVTGLNLVRMQFDIAAGAALPEALETLTPCGHAIEARLYAEDPLAGFAPQTGLIARFEPDAAARMPGLRIDAGFETGDRVGSAYDSMLAKIIARGATRAEAIERLIAGLNAAPPLGLKTNRDFLIALVGDPAFRAGEIRTTDLDQWQAESTGPFAPSPVPAAALALGALMLARSPGGVLRSGSVTAFDLDLTADGESVRLGVRQTGPDRLEVGVGDKTLPVEYVSETPDGVRWRLDGVEQSTPLARANGALWIALPGRIVTIAEPSPVARDPLSDPSRIAAPVSGLVTAVNVALGDRVEAGQLVAVMEAMKMEMRLEARAAGLVVAVNAAPGVQAAGGSILIELELASED